MGLKFANFAYSQIAVGISSGDVTIAVTGGHGARFPVLGVGDYFYATIENASSQREIVRVTARATDSLTVVRGQDNTTAQAWLAGDSIALRFNAAAVEAIRDESGAVLLSGNQTIAGTKTFSSAPVVPDASFGLAKLASIATARILGRLTAGSGVTEELTLAQIKLNTPLRGHIDGLTLSTAGSSTTMAVAAGEAADSTTTALLTLAASISKTTSAWAVGTAAGGLDTGAIANSTWYHFHLIRRPDTGVVDVLFSLSATAPTLPTNYTQFRRIGSGRTNGSAQWVRFFQTGDRFLWDNLGTLDFNGTSSSTAALVTLSVPTGLKVRALLNVQDSNPFQGTTHLISDPDVTDVAPSATAWPLGVAGAPQNGTGTRGQVEMTTNTSAQIRQRNTRSDGTITIATIGWVDDRGRA